MVRRRRLQSLWVGPGWSAPYYNHPRHIRESLYFSANALADILQYTVCDIVLLLQIYYYRWTSVRQLTAPPLVAGTGTPTALPSEETPLIRDTQGPEDRKASHTTLRQFAIYGGALAFVLGTGAIAWAVDEHIHRGQRRAPPKEVFEWKSQVLGWISAVLYRELHTF